MTGMVATVSVRDVTLTTQSAQCACAQVSVEFSFVIIFFIVCVTRAILQCIAFVASRCVRDVQFYL
jgi:hypothetical protein